MWNFFKMIVITVFIISLILLKTAPKDSEIYSGRKTFLTILAIICGIPASICIFNFVIDVTLSMLFQLIIEGFHQFFLGFGF